MGNFTYNESVYESVYVNYVSNFAFYIDVIYNIVDDHVGNQSLNESKYNYYLYDQSYYESKYYNFMDNFVDYNI